MSFAHAISAQAHLRAAQVKPRSGGRSQNKARESLGIAGRPAAAPAAGGGDQD
ncbi:hypothetical protein [Ottowia sp.]|uniref:hypothetical protein n=1 Tax=Ottowia sp. TaxID=1898956 RepID=UPI002C72D10D|nr:hypothetical protein [Ottowia sp.]